MGGLANQPQPLCATSSDPLEFTKCLLFYSVLPEILVQLETAALEKLLLGYPTVG